MPPPQQQPATQNKFDAFNSIQQQQPKTSPTGGDAASVTDAVSNLSVASEPAKKAASVKENPSKYKAGQKVYYKSASYVGKAEIVKVHLDDELEPFYTIKVQDKEKQTDNAHLEEMSPLQQEIVDMLWNMDEERQKQVKQYIVQQLSSGGGSLPSPSQMTMPKPPSAPSLNGTMTAPKSNGPIPPSLFLGFVVDSSSCCRVAGGSFELLPFHVSLLISSSW